MSRLEVRGHRNPVRPRLKRVLPFLLTIVSVLISLVIAEIVLRQLGYVPRTISLNANFWVSGWAQMDEELGWRNREGSFRSVEPGHALMSFGADGRRADPISSKPASAPKIVFVGCSFTQGEGVADDETYAHVVNRDLKTLDVINYGTGAYGTYQSLLRMRSYFRAPHPQTPLVIYGLLGHHMIRNLASSEWVSTLTTRDGRFLIPPHVRSSGDRIVEHKADPIDLWPLETRMASVALAHAAFLKISRKRPWQEHHDALRQLLTQMKSITTENKASFLVVNLWGAMAEDVEWMRGQGVDYIDCQNPEVLSAAYRVGGVGHPNGLMHDEWAQCVLRALRERGYDAGEPVPAMN